MKFYKELIESVIDIPRKDYAIGVFDGADSENPKLKQKVLDMIAKQIKEFEELAPIVSTSLIGSILTKRYRNDADLDINVLFDVPEDEQEERREQYSKLLRDINGKNVPGTEHPVNYYVITDPKVLENNNKKADGIFSINDNKWIKKPDEDTFKPEKYEADFRKQVQELDIINGELKRDIIDYQELKQLTNNDVLNLQELVNEKLEEIEESIRKLKSIGDTLTTDRRDIFSRDMTPDEIREFGKQNKLPKNVIYKMLEKYHYMKFYKKLKDILEDDKVTDKEIDSLKEAPEYSKGTAVFTFGRFNPPTTGHQKLITKVNNTPGDFKYVYLSKSQDAKSNPLSVTQKISYMRKMFPQHRGMFRIPSSNMILDVATELFNKGYTNINMVVGSDRVQDFKRILNQYNNVKSRHGFYNFKSIKITSAGERDPDAAGATGMSASKMRSAVAQGDIKSFAKGLPSGFRDIKPLFRDVAVGMRVDFRKALAASTGQVQGYSFNPVASLEGFEKKQLRDLYIREVIFNINDKVHYIKEDMHGKIVRRSTNYIVLEDSEENLHKAWIYDCVPDSADKEVAIREFNLDVDYGFTAVTEGDMNEKKTLDQDPDIKKEPETQLKKYKQMYGEVTSSAERARGSDRPIDVTYNYTRNPEGFENVLKGTTAGKKLSVQTKLKGVYVLKGKSQYHIDFLKKLKDRGIKESYEIGADYANHTKDVTPGQTPDEKPVDSKLRTPKNSINKDIEKDKYKMKTFKEYAETKVSDLD